MVVTAANLTQADLDLIKAAIDPHRITDYWVGGPATTDLIPQKTIEGPRAPDIIKIILKV